MERRHSDVAPVLGGRVCFLVGNEDGNRIFLAFLKNKRLPYFKKISVSSKLKKVRITNVLVNFLLVCPLIKGGYSMEVSGSGGKKVLWEEV